jgi:hypothetical protein
LCTPLLALHGNWFGGLAARRPRLALACGRVSERVFRCAPQAPAAAARQRASIIVHVCRRLRAGPLLSCLQWLLHTITCTQAPTHSCVCFITFLLLFVLLLLCRIFERMEEGTHIILSIDSLCFSVFVLFSVVALLRAPKSHLDFFGFLALPNPVLYVPFYCCNFVCFCPGLNPALSLFTTAAFRSLPSSAR